MLSIVKSFLTRSNSTVQRADALITEAERFPRYTEHTFKYRDLVLNVTDFISVAWQLKEIFEGRELMVPKLSEKSCIIDCGANVGVSVIYFAKTYPGMKILAYEPDEKLFECLQKNLDVNKIENVGVFKKAVWVDNNGINFLSDGADGGAIVSDTNKPKVESVRLKDILHSENEVGLLKIDIEGAEVSVIEDCKLELKNVQYIFVEYHSFKNRNQQLDKLLKTLSEAGFRYYIRSIGRNPVNPFIESEPTSDFDIQLNIHAERI